MKKVYESPVFLAEAYSFSSSIANCTCKTDTNTPTEIRLGQNLCSVGDNGHQYSKKSPAYELCNSEVTTIFNDGMNNNACVFDWAGKGKPVQQTNLSFAKTFYGNGATEKNHAPVFFS